MSLDSSGDKWARPEDWEAHRETIKGLYWDQSLGLQEVMEIMQQNHQFFATRRMYKSRFKAWGLNKYREMQIRRPKRITTGQGPTESSNVTIHVTQDGSVGPVKAKRSARRETRPEDVRIVKLGFAGNRGYLSGTTAQVRRGGSSTRAPSTSTTSLPSILRAPDVLRLPEECIRAVLDYTHNRLETRAWSFSDDNAEQTGVSEWFNKAVVAKETIQRGNIQAGFRMLQICFQQYQLLALDGRPELFQKTLGLAFILLEVGSDLAESFIRYTASLCSIVLGGNHPLSRIWRALRASGIPGLRRYAMAILQAQCGILMNHLGPRNKFLAVMNLETARSYHRFGVIQMSTAKELIQSLVDDMMADISYWTMDFVLWSKIELASTYVQDENFAEADGVLLYIGNCLAATPADGFDLWNKTQYYWLKARVMDGLGLHSEATEMHQARLNVCLEEVGPEHRHTMRALGDLENYYRKVGDVEAAEKLKLDFETKWDRICEREASPSEVPVEV
ncbi:Clr5 domain-containing protein [Xylariales sp. AK1849]|nr:Clr5 domain-containing protein [Xylariales sp. AK1849]